MDRTATVLAGALAAVAVIAGLTALLVRLVRTRATGVGEGGPVQAAPPSPCVAGGSRSLRGAGNDPVPDGRAEALAPPVWSACCMWLPEAAWSNDDAPDLEVRLRAYTRWERLRDDVHTVRRTIGA